MGDSTAHISESIQQLGYANSLRPYPVCEWAALVSDDEQPLPFGVLTDAMLVLTGTEDRISSRPYLSSLYIGPSLVSVTFRFCDEDVAVCTIPISSLTPYSAVQVTPLADFVAGTVSFADIRPQDNPTRLTFSTEAQSALDDTAFIVVPPPGIVSFEDDVSGLSLQGDVAMTVPKGVSVNVSHGKLSLQMSDSLNASLVPSCYPSGLDMVCEAPVIRTINGVAPDSEGVIAIKFA